MINSEILKGHWNEIRGQLKKRWGQLSDSELDQIEGDRDRLVGTIQRETGETREQIEAELDRLLQRAQAMAPRAVEAVRHVAEETGKRVQESYAQVQRSLQEGYTGTEHFVQRHPMESVAIVFAGGLVAGFVVGLSVASRR